MESVKDIPENIRLALDFSRSFATAKPNIGRTEKEHIEGLANLLERVSAEREALQLMLNKLEEQNHSLEQRRHAEQQACQAAERRVKELEGWLLEARRCVLECVDDEAGGPTRNEAQAILSGVDATLNPTAEAVSHE